MKAMLSIRHQKTPIRDKTFTLLSMYCMILSELEVNDEWVENVCLSVAY